LVAPAGTVLGQRLPGLFASKTEIVSKGNAFSASNGAE